MATSPASSTASATASTFGRWVATEARGGRHLVARRGMERVAFPVASAVLPSIAWATPRPKWCIAVSSVADSGGVGSASASFHRAKNQHQQHPRRSHGFECWLRREQGVTRVDSSCEAPCARRAAAVHHRRRQAGTEQVRFLRCVGCWWAAVLRRRDDRRPRRARVARPIERRRLLLHVGAQMQQ